MKKLLPLLAILAIFHVSAQINPNTPWVKALDLDNRATQPTFQELVDAGNAYFETIDKDAKGSGYKPFKRWEDYWQDFVDENGYLPTRAQFWNSIQSVQSFLNTRDSQADDSNWTPLGPMDFANRSTSTANIGRVNVIVKDPNNPNTYYAGAPAGGIWKSTDAGLTWEIKNNDMPQLGVSGIAIDPNNSNIVYIATGDDDHSDAVAVGVWKSTDGGDTWNPTGLNTSNSPSNLNDIYVSPNDSNTLLVATTNGVYKSTDAGASWNITQGGNIRDIKIKPGSSNIVYAVSSSNFYKSTNGGDSFTQITTGLPATSTRLVIDVTPANPNYVYLVSAGAGSAYQGIYKSVDDGATFTQTANNTDIFQSTQAWYDLALAVSDTNEEEIYVGVLNVWKSTNGGDSFSLISNNSWRSPSYTHVDIHFLRFFDGELYAGTDGGFFKSSDGGSSFTDLTTGMEITQFYRIDVSPYTSEKMVGGTQDNGGFGYFNQWNHYHHSDGMEGVVDPNNDNIYYAFRQFGNLFFISTDAGQSGSTQYSGAENGNWVTPLNVNSLSEVYAGYSRVYQFIGGSWTAISPSFGGALIDRMEIDPANPDVMYLAINQHLYKSTDRGQNYTNVESFGAVITSIEVNNNNSDVVYVTTSGFNGDVFRSDDGGDNFTDITGSLPNVVKRSIVHRGNDPINTLYLGTHMGIYRYDDNTNDWEIFANNFPNSDVRDLAINLVDEVLLAGTHGRGIWSTPIGAAALADDDVSLVKIDSPGNSNFSCDEELIPQVQVKNNGLNTISSINVTYNVDGGADQNFEWTGTLASEETTLVDLPAIAGLSRGEHSISVSLDIVNDAFPNNNNSISSFYVNDSGVAQLVNTFETPAEELIAVNAGGGTPLWERGVPTGTLLNSASSGTQVYGTNLDGNHTDNTRAYLFSQCYDLSEITKPVLKFQMAFDIEFDWDLAYVQYTTDQGDNWSLLGTANDPNWYNSSRIAGDGIANNCFNCVGGQWTGTNATMQEYSYDLDALTNEPSVIFRIVFHSDQAVTQEGVIIDDFYVDGTLSTGDFELGSVKIYPNPSNNIFNIKLNGVDSFNYNVVDITGKTILSKRNIGQNNYALDMSEFATGIYFLNLSSQGRTLTKKLILK